MVRSGSVLLVIGLALSGAGCGREPDPLAETGGVDGPVLVAAAPGDSSGIDDALVVGEISLDGGCLYLSNDELLVEPTLILWPHGTRWQAEPAAVVLRNGDEVPIGASVDGGGGYYAPAELWRFSSDPAVIDAATQCAVSPTTGVAVFQGPLPDVRTS